MADRAIVCGFMAIAGLGLGMGTAQAGVSLSSATLTIYYQSYITGI